MIKVIGRLTITVCVTGLASILSGCGAGQYATATVTGTVLCDGKPAHGGEIRFRPIDAPAETGRPAGYPGQDSYGTVEADGSFSLAMEATLGDKAKSGALIGRHDVIFELPLTSPQKLNAEDRRNFADDPQGLAEIQKRLDAIPVYKVLSCSAKITPTEIEVKPGSNSFEFTLQP